MHYDNYLKNRKSVLVGRAALRVAEAKDYISETGIILDSGNSLGHVVEIELSINKEVDVRRRLTSDYPAEIDSRVNDLKITCNPMESTTENIARALGQDEIDSIDGILEGEFGFGGKTETFWRVEAGIVFPERTHKFDLIIPKTKIVSDFSIPLTSLEGITHELVFQALDATHGKISSVNWYDSPLGKWKFSTK